MKITSLRLNNIRSYEGDATFEFSPTVNLLVGPNGSGKSTVIWALNLLQTEDGSWKSVRDESALRIGTDIGAIDYCFDTFNGNLLESLRSNSGASNRGIRFEISKGGSLKTYYIDARTHQHTSTIGGGIAVFRRREPDNLYYLFLSRRKPESYQEGVNLDAQQQITPNFMFLPAKVDRLAGGSRARKRIYDEYLQRVLGHDLSTKGVSTGKAAGLYVGESEDFIRLEYMGEGTANVAALLADLTVARGRVFLIEEPENDLHPAALKALLDIMAECSEQNQFIISTHSHIVLTRLAAQSGTRVFGFHRDANKPIPTTQVSIIPDTPESRLQLMQELGYELSDIGQWTAVLVLEESSAQAIIEKVLIPWFAPKLVARLRAVSASGVDRVPLAYDSLHYTYLYLHLSPIYKDYSWVRIDGGEHSENILENLRKRYRVADEFKFRAYSRTAFELYYPSRFDNEVSAALGIRDKQARRKAKAELCGKVLDWAVADTEAAKAEFSESAAEVIEDLRRIEAFVAGRALA